MKKITFILGTLLCTVLIKAQTNILPEISLVPFATGLAQPVGIEHAGDARLFILEKVGRIRILDTNGKFKSQFLNITDRVLSSGFEQGLLGIAFDPDYEDNGYFYVHYTNLDGNSRFSRFSVNPNNPDKAKANSEVIFLEDEDPFANHNSGQMKFGPDGYLYFTIGDGGSGGDPFNNAQDGTILLGKLMRIDPQDDGSYDIPPSNPFAGPDAFFDEIWASGLRNPWRFTFDKLTGDLWIPDVGQNLWEEVNMTPASSTGGENYGWSCMEGTHFFKADCDNNGIPFQAPIAEYAHDDVSGFPCSGSITGGYVYRGDQYPNMYGKYFYTDFCTGVIRTTYWDGSAWVTAVLGNFTPFAYSTFGEDIDGELYLADQTSGNIYRFTDGASAPMAQRKDEVTTYVDRPGINIHVKGDALTDHDEVIKEEIYQNTVRIQKTSLSDQVVLLSPNPNHGQFIVQVDAPEDALYSINVRDITGKVILTEEKEAHAGTNEWNFHSPQFVDGVYVIQLRSDAGTSVMKFVVE